jgi:hypothetical protein
MIAIIAAIPKATAHPRQVARPGRGEGGSGGGTGGDGGVLNAPKNACDSVAKKLEKGAGCGQKKLGSLPGNNEVRIRPVV